MIIRKKNPQKFIPYFELRDAFQKEGCPICHLLLTRSLATLDTLLYEQVTDPISRKRLRQAHGLCNWHAWMLCRILTGGSGITIIYEDLLGHQIQSLHTLHRVLRPRSAWQRLQDRFRGSAKPPFLAFRHGKTPCPVCDQQGRVDEVDLLRTLLDFLSEPAFVQGFQDSFGLCLPHLALTVERQRQHPALRLLLELEITKFARLQQELRERIRKFDYRFADESVGEEGTAWRRALELFVGKPGVFGNDRCGRRETERS